MLATFCKYCYEFVILQIDIFLLMLAFFVGVPHLPFVVSIHILLILSACIMTIYEYLWLIVLIRCLIGIITKNIHIIKI